MTHSVFKAGYLPGLTDADVSWHRLSVGTGTSTGIPERMNTDISLGTQPAPLQVDVPQLTTAQMKALAQRVQDASRRHLKTMPVSDIIRVLDKATARLLDANDSYRQQLERLLPQATGFDAEMVRLNLNAYLQTFRGLQLQRFVAEDFANPKVLDEFQPRTQGGWTRAFGPELLVHVWAGNVPALPMWSFVSGLLVKAGSIGKVSSAEPVFATLFARLLAEVEPRWADCFAVVWWPSGTLAQTHNIAEHAPDSAEVFATERTTFALADVVLAYGGNEALQAMQAHVPVTTRFLPHGHKLSFGMVSAAALSVHKAPSVARQAALDVARYDQQGCYSPHVFYVQRGAPVSPHDFAQHLAHALATLQHKLPRRVLSLEEAAQAGTWREAHEFASFNDDAQCHTENSSTVFSDTPLNDSAPHAPLHAVLGSTEGLSTSTVVFSERPLPLNAGPLNRHVLVVAVNTLDDVMPLIAPQRDYLQTVGLATAPEELLHLSSSLGQAGVTRICALGSMTSPEAGWHHDGRFSLLDLVRMVDIEASTEREAESFTSYEV
ncbi:acyl-CoA reductase [Limnohabitans sp. B9-3]|uniref:acyl-CoA reductase n=1 Tax=Limnohabitans sp. B9-3 TaxID=1100707 RepID=UPI000C1DF804|nr:acyl-CoA reductase [Limnohabitans sp. B9-3]PIT73642.1 acyl-CoA reductase [Limnohabitans sp. B9-3]